MYWLLYFEDDVIKLFILQICQFILGSVDNYKKGSKSLKEILSLEFKYTFYIFHKNAVKSVSMTQTSEQEDSKFGHITE